VNLQEALAAEAAADVQAPTPPPSAKKARGRKPKK
jgi:hypothetical protein